jgi:ankyrin repeat protein
LQELPSSGVSSLVNTQGGRYGNAPQAASVRGHDEIVELLLDKGVDTNASDRYYDNAPSAASAEGQDRIVELLLHKGANVDAPG